MEHHSQQPDAMLSNPASNQPPPHTTILEAARSAIFTLDKDCRIQHITPSIKTLTGHSVQDVLGKPYLEMVADEWRATAQNLCALSDAHDTRVDELPLRTVSGELCWVRHTSVRLPDENSVIRYQCMIQDITAQKHTEQTLKATEKRNKILLDTLPDTILVLTRDGNVTDVHTSGDQPFFQFGSASDVQGLRLEDLGLPESALEDARFCVEMALALGNMHSFEFNMPAADPNWKKYYDMRVVALNDEEVLAVIRDITTLKRVQEQQRQHFEALAIVRQMSDELAEISNFNYVAQLTLDSALRLSSANSGFLAMTQGDGTLVLLGQIGAYQTQQVRQMLERRAGIISEVVHEQRPILHPDVTKLPEYIPLLPETRALMVMPLVSRERFVGLLYLEARKAERFSQERFEMLQLLTGRIAAFLDNANLYRQTQEQLAELTKLYEEVRQLEQLKTDMIRIASHDLKNPLAGIMGYLEMLRWDIEETLDETQLDYLQNIDSAARKMQRITSSILSLERIQQMAQETARESVNLTELVRRTVGEQMDEAVRKQQSVNRLLPDEAVLIEGDPMQLHEAMANLVSNAVKYTPDEGTIDVSLHVEGDQAQVRIRDTGYGIPKDQQERLFSPFYRVRTAETRKIEGTGLGLHLVKNIIERHDGTMFFESEYGTGSTFGFDLPLQQENDSPLLF